MPLLPEPVTVSNVLSRRINARGYKTMSAPIAACLLCLLIVGASLDRLPDPPAVKPQGNLNTWFLSFIPRYPLQRGTTHRITWPSILTFRPACFRLGRFSKVEDLPTIRPLCTKRQTRLLPAFLKVDSPAHEVPKRPTLF